MTRNAYLIIAVLLFGLTACTNKATNAPLDGDEASPIIDASGAVTAIVPGLELTDEPTPKVQLSFESATYFDEEGRFELQFPVDWVEGYGERQSRGYFRQLVSWDISESNSIEFRPEGATFVQVLVIAWEPFNDLNARLDIRMQSWENMSFIIHSEEELLVDGQRAVQFVYQSPNSVEPAFLFMMVIGDRYLELGGQGDIDLLAEIAGTVRVLDAAQ